MKVIKSYSFETRVVDVLVHIATKKCQSYSAALTQIILEEGNRIDNPMVTMSVIITPYNRIQWTGITGSRNIYTESIQTYTTGTMI